MTDQPCESFCAAAGRSLAYIDGYEKGGSAFVSAIWYGALPGTAALHGQTLAQMRAAEVSNLSAGRLMHGVTQYTTPASRCTQLSGAPVLDTSQFLDSLQMNFRGTD